MVVIGITGPTGAGKSTALQALERLGGVTIDCDAVYHRLLDQDMDLRRELEERFGPLTQEDGTFCRKELGEIVFRDPAALAALNAIAHRRVIHVVEGLLVQAEEAGAPCAAVDAIALWESGVAQRLCHHTVAVVAPKEQRVARIMAREGLSLDYAQARVDAQQPEGFYTSRCGHTLTNDGDTPEGLAQAARDLFIKIIQMEAAKRQEGVFSDMEEKKELSRGEQLRQSLLHRPKNGYDRVDAQELAAMDSYCVGYKQFIDNGKTERECVEQTIALAQAAGFRPYVRGMALQPGDKIYQSNRGRAITLAVIGRQPLNFGANIGAAHIDAPRLDLKQNPLYEDSEQALLKTHYYGGIRKYQWVAIPLELRGVIALPSGQVIRVSIGSGEGDPQFTITDLLPHLAAEQSKKPLGEAIPGEGLNILVGSRPLKDDDGADRVKLSVLELLNRKYGITEQDFLSAELIAVPAFRAVDIGFDRSMIGAYGHDDRVCSYAALAALLQLGTPERTAVCMLADKEEIGSEGVSGMRSAAFDTFMEDLCAGQNVPLRACFEKSFCLSADVTAAFDPNFPEVYEKRNSAFLNYGMGICKYTGARGKSGASDASAELMAYTRKVLDDAGVLWQTAELGKVDKGGGGTVAAFMAERNIDTIDAGVPVLSMHAPFETVAKLDCYMTFKGMKAVFEAV